LRVVEIIATFLSQVMAAWQGHCYGRAASHWVQLRPVPDKRWFR